MMSEGSDAITCSMGALDTAIAAISIQSAYTTDPRAGAALADILRSLADIKSDLRAALHAAQEREEPTERNINPKFQGGWGNRI